MRPFPASDPVAITIDQPPPPEGNRAPKVVGASLMTRASILRGPLIAEAEAEAKITEQRTSTGPFNAMLWDPFKSLIGGHS
jgi:hypothetical protein